MPFVWLVSFELFRVVVIFECFPIIVIFERLLKLWSVIVYYIALLLIRTDDLNGLLNMCKIF
jgi:hypothetical protein